MSVSPISAAKKLCRDSGWSLSNLKLQKLLYLAHMVHLGRTESPLIDGHFEAWDYGPVQPDVYRLVRAFGREPISDVFHQFPDVPEGTEGDTLDEILRTFGHAKPGQLVAMTHQNHGAWADHYLPGKRGTRIPDTAILEEYRKRVNRNSAK